MDRWRRCEREQLFIYKPSALPEPLRRPRLSEQNIQCKPDEGQSDQQQQPRRARIGVAPRKQDCPDDDSEVERRDDYPDGYIQFSQLSATMSPARRSSVEPTLVRAETSRQNTHAAEFDTSMVGPKISDCLRSHAHVCV